MKLSGWIIAGVLGGAMLPAFAAQAVSESKESRAQLMHQGAGKVVSVNPDQSGIRIAHDPISSLGWPSMTMNFTVAKTTIPDGLKAGDDVKFELRQLESKKWEIVKIERR